VNTDDPRPPLSAGRLYYLAVHRPWAAVRGFFRDGGPLARRETERQRRMMEAAAKRLRLPTPPRRRPPEHAVHFLSGHRFWWQTIWCAVSLARHAARSFQWHIHDDGTLTEEQAHHLRQALGEFTVVHSREELAARVDALLPADRFPTLRDRHRHYPHLRKLVDPHLAQPGWNLVLDSDMLFFRRPDFLLRWLEAPDRPLHLVDCQSSYGYPAESLKRLAGRPLPERVNVGACGLNSRELDWDWIERCCRSLVGRHGTSYFLEQALVALIVTGRETAVAPAADYVCKPDWAEVVTPRAVLHHYVADSKTAYFREGWRRCGVPLPT
jgi:hypothetical protein